MRGLLSFLIISMAALTVAVACAGSEDGNETLDLRDPLSAAPTAVPGQPVPTSAPLPTATPAPMSAIGVQADDSDRLVFSPAQAPQSQRVIVRTADLVVEVADISSAMDHVGNTASLLGGWVVSSQQTELQRGFVSVRVPADRLDDALDRIKATATKVVSETSTSQDFTDQYFDTQSRVRNLRATEEALLRLLDRAEEVEDALKVQTELTMIQEQVEVLQGRLTLLEQTSAFSLVNVEVRLRPTAMQVDAGGDIKVRDGESVSFRVTFTPPAGVVNFSYTWDFGDGAVATGTRTARIVDGEGRVTATVSHVYRESEASPFIVTFSITGFGESGAAEGEDTLTVDVLEVPSIAVFAGQHLTLTEREGATFNGSFTRAEGLSNFRYRWDFGDGTTPAEGTVAEGQTSVSVTHTYANHRPTPYLVTLRITADSEAGPVESSDSIQAEVGEASPWTTGWSMRETVRVAVLVLSFLGNLLLSMLIWGAIFSPIWLLPLGVVYIIVRRRRRR